MKIVQPPQSGRHWRAIWMLVLATAFWGLSFPTVKALALVQSAIEPGSNNWFIAAATVGPRFVIGALIMLIAQFFSRTPGRTTALEWKQGLGMGLFASGGMILQNDGLQFTEASTSAFLTQLAAILIPLYVAFRARKSPGPRTWFCCALVMIGVAILGHFNLSELHFGRGEIETLIGAFFFAGQILWLDRSEFANNRVSRITLIMFASEAFVYLALALFTMPSLHALFKPWASPAWLMLTMLLVVFCTLGAFLLMNTWQPKITATEAGLIYCLEPIFGSLLALFLPALFSGAFAVAYPNETATWTLLTGGAFITAANIILQLRPPPKTVPPRTD